MKPQSISELTFLGVFDLIKIKQLRKRTTYQTLRFSMVPRGGHRMMTKLMFYVDLPKNMSCSSLFIDAIFTDEVVCWQNSTSNHPVS